MRFIPIIFFLLTIAIRCEPFRIASYNVQNLFDEIYDGTEYAEFVPKKGGWSRRLSDVKIDRVAEVICDLDAEIVALQEVENERIFQRLRKRLRRVGCDYGYGAITRKKGAPIQVALLSKFPIVKSASLRVSYAPRVRDILEVLLRIDNSTLRLFVNHWKSKSRKGYESKRIVYAKRLQKRLAELPKGEAYVVLGDFNTNYDAHRTLPARLDDTSGKRGLQHLLHTLQTEEPVDVCDMRHAQETLHYDLWFELPYADRWSHRYFGRKSTLDHILLPASLFDGRGIDYVDGSFGVFKPRYLFTKRGYINDWRVKNGKHTARGYSDHLPIFAEFDTKPFVLSKEKCRHKSVVGTIESLYLKERLDSPVILKNVAVVLKRGRYGVIKQSPEGRGIFLFGAVKGLKEGRRYDLEVYEIGKYKGLKEITAAVPLKERGAVDLSLYYGSLDRMRQNEVLKGLEGRLKGGYFHTKGKKIPIYFKNRKITPPEGAKLKIDIAHLGYYKRLQLVVYSRKDFSVTE